MRYAPIVVPVTFTLALAAAVATAAPAEFDVPSGAYPTLADGVAAAAASLEPENIINLQSNLTVGDEIVLDAAFNGGHRLLIRPDPDLGGLGRAAILSVDPDTPIFRMFDLAGGYVTLQDLDLLRNTTNDHHLIEITEFGHVTIERCRLGSIWPTAGSHDWSVLQVAYPTEVTIRNCVFFSVAPATFDRGVHAFSFTDADNSLRLYNNVVADFRLYGIHVEASQAGALVLLRNNVVCNHPNAPAASEPFAYRSDVLPGVGVVASHNVAFASAGHEESIAPGDQSIAGAAAFKSLTRPQIVPSFIQWQWITAPPGHPNPDFFRLGPGPLHDSEDDLGVTVTDGAPHPEDLAVVDDWERDPRPSGSPTHTDRGADQLDQASTGVGPAIPAAGSSRFTVAPRRTPTHAIELAFGAAVAGVIEVEVFDASGRRVHRATCAVGAGAAGAFTWPAPRSSGVYPYRAVLRAADGALERTSGHLVVVR